jgi:tartrate-resistant acid phosphatase type 5
MRITGGGVVWFIVYGAKILHAQEDVGRIHDGSALHFLAFGDFGTGSAEQMRLAKAMGRRHTQEQFHLGITLGDNFYRCGVRGVDDPKWKTRWEQPYGPLGVEVYAALGNHDYGHPPAICPGAKVSPEAQIAYSKHSKTWRMPARYYTYKAGPVQFIAIDTEGWSEKQLEWIGKTLEKSAKDPDVKWRIVYGHHPMYTSGVHLNQRRIGALRRNMFPVLKAGRVDLYIAGHDHDLEHLRHEGIEMLICGGGGAKLRGVRSRDPASVWARSRNAFLDIKATDRELTARFLDSDLVVLETPPLVMRK